MSKHYRTAGSDSRAIIIAGKRYQMRPLTVGVYADMENYIVAQRPDPLQIASAAVAKLPSSHHDAVWRAAMAQAINARTVTAEEAAAFENSVNGLSWKVWQCLRQDHPEIDSLDAARELIISAGEEHFENIARATEIASGEADIKKSSGQAEEQTEPPAGQSSTEDSPTRTAGHQTKSTG